MIRRFEAGDRDWLHGEHRGGYARDEGFDASFGVLVGQILDGFLASHDPVCEAGWIAQQEGVRLGSIFCVRHDETSAKLRLFLLNAQARGKGLGRRLLLHNMGFAREVGYRRMQLWTHESHRAACALYAQNGWEMTQAKPVMSFGRANVEQSWAITF
ncbi:MAG: GNAT family N-acetyltransferase [Sulfitobacter sp.]